MIHPDVLEGWRKAALSDDYSYLIHPTGHDDEAYEQSGKLYADRIMSKVKQYADQLKPKTKGMPVIMDYGCGNGRILRHIPQPSVGIDIVPEAAAMVGGYVPSEYTGKVDVIYSVNVLIHNTYADGCAIIAWMRERLKKGGLLLLQMPIYDTAKEPTNYLDVGVWTYDMLVKATEGYKIIEAKTNPGSFSFETIGPNHFDFHTLTKL